MLLPSDVARLVLGYLQQEGLSATSQSFILESPNLREYAEHSSEDGVIPACMFSLFGKNLTTILSEYVAAKAKETCQENQIPAVMTSLWKKLDFTLNQIKSMQNSPAVQQIQRLRTHNSIQNMRRQRALSSPLTPATGSITVSTPGNCVPRPLPTPQGILGHSTPVCYTSQHTRPSTISLSQSEETPLQIIVPDHRFTPGPLSPARRKCDSPRRRGGQLGISRGVTVTSMLTVESQSQEALTENLSQIVIENVREKILKDRSLQEKLAENINKFIIPSENSPQTSKAACSTVEQEQSIDEILGLQGEIHMTDDAIQDILEQTASDPAFQALFELFDYGKNKTPDGSESAERSNSAQETDEPGHTDSATDTGTGQDDSTSGAETTTRILRSRNVKDVKSKRKIAIPLSTGQPDQAPSQTFAGLNQTATPRTPQSKKAASRKRVSGGKNQTRGANSSLKDHLTNRTQYKSSSDPNASTSSLSEEGASMEVDNPTSEMSLDCNTDGTPQCLLQTVSSSKKLPASTTQAETTPNVGADTSGAEEAERTQLVERAPESSGQSEPSISIANDASIFKQASIQQSATNKVTLLSTVMQEESNSKTSSPGPLEPSDSVGFGSTACSSVSSTILIPSQSQTTESDPNKIVTLKIIVSDEQEQQGGDNALNQAVSSISVDRIPTIFLSSPAKSQTNVLPSPSSSITAEETALAVSNLPGSESTGDQAIITHNSLQPPQTRLKAPETGFIRLLPASPAFGGTSSYFVVTDQGSVDQHSSMMLLSGGTGESAVCSTPHVVATPPRPRAVVSIAQNVARPFSPASAIIISSPVQSMIQNMTVPVSVFGQNNTGKVTVVPSQMFTVPGPNLLSQSANVVSNVISKDNVESGKTGTPVNPAPNSSQGSEQLNNSSGVIPNHRRILCFDENSGQPSTNAVASSPVMKESTRAEQTHSANSKRRVETIRLSEPSHSTGTKELEKASIPQQQTGATKNTETGTDWPVEPIAFTNDSVQQKQSALSEPKRRIQPTTIRGDSAVLSNPEYNLKSSSQSLRPKSAIATKGISQEEKREQRPVKTSDGPSESTVTQSSPSVTANKENEIEGSRQEARQAAPPLLSTVRSTAPGSQGGAGKPTCKTSPLTKQAAEMLQDIQSQSLIVTPPRKRSSSDLLLPKTPVPGRLHEDLLEGLRTPSRQRHGREGEATPKHLVPPATPDLPTCSPASEAGSESSINMAAHTLMILSRAARTGGPLKDSLRQEEAGAAKSGASKGKKRKHVEPSSTAKKELHLTSSSGSKKKAKKQKKLLDSFPHDLDVDKFLSSLHYDE